MRYVRIDDIAKTRNLSIATLIGVSLMSHASRFLGFRKALIVGSLLGLSGVAQTALASSPDAWEEFRRDVEKSCRAAVKGVIDPQVVQVDPYGSESYGFAVLVGPEASGSKLRLVACAYDKRRRRAEVSAAFDW